MRKGTTALLLAWLATVYAAWTWHWIAGAIVAVLGLLLVTAWSWSGGEQDV